MQLVPDDNVKLLHCIILQSCNGCNGNIVCAREGSGRTCNGDSGSFMGVQQGGRWVVHGVTSFGFAVRHTITTYYIALWANC